MTIHERQLPSPESEKRRNIGVASLIINLDGKIYTVKELRESKNTERTPGQVSVSTEKSKTGESLKSNLLGALGEFCSDVDIPILREHLFLVGLPRLTPVDLDGKALTCSLATIVCDVDIYPTPAHSEEVGSHGWISLPDALNLPELRPLSRQILTVVDRESLVEEGLKNYVGGVKDPILTDFGFSNSFERFVRQRNLLPDSYGNEDRTSGVNGEIRFGEEKLSLFPKKVLLGEPHGLCAGVVRSIGAYQEAINMLRTKNPQAEIHSLGEPAHNTFVNDKFRQQGVIFINSPKEAPEGATILLGAHGTDPSVLKTAENLGQRLIDTVCPLVTKTHTEAIRFQEEDHTIIYFGKKGHQEAEALLGESQKEGNIILVEKLEDLEEIEKKVKDPKRVAFLSQTTHPASKAEEIKQVLLRQFPDLKYPSHTDTCFATENRQGAVREMVKNGARKVVVVGSRTSSNSLELKNVAIEEGAEGIFVDSADELELSQFTGVEIVGLTSGASVLEKTFLEVVQWLRGNGATDFVSAITADESNIRFGPVKM